MDDLDLLEEEAVQAAIDGDWQVAIKANKELIKLGHKTVAIYNRLGKAYSETQKWDKAIKCFENSLKLDPVNSVAQKGLNNAKMDRKAGSSLKTHVEKTLVRDANTTHILELNLKKADTEEPMHLVLKNEFYMLTNISSGKQLKRVGKSKLNLKQDANPETLQVEVIDMVKRGLYKIEVSSKDPVFKAAKQNIDPSIERKSKDVIAEKKEIEKIIEEEREEE
jgi:tetratricopeptide (TPR) repeat protein